MLLNSATRLIQPLSLDDRFLSTLRQSARWHIHSAFDNTVNLTAPNLPLLTLSNQKTDSLPLSLMTQNVNFSSLSIQIGQAVHHDEHALYLPHHDAFALTAKPQSHSLAVATDALDVAALSSALATLRATLKQQASPGSFVPSVGASAFELGLSRCLHQQAQTLQQTLRTAQAAPIDAAVLGLLGLGVGLTPSGDDYLVGVLAALRLNQSAAPAAAALSASISRHAERQTNAISVQALSCASQYYFKSSLIDLIHSLAQGQTPAAVQHLSQLLQTGSTSGTDIAYGVLDTLLLFTLAKDVP
ncbi:MAG: oxamate carbamoyltransferase subunit AllH family protein [Neisseriaceae bacterium]